MVGIKKIFFVFVVNFVFQPIVYHAQNFWLLQLRFMMESPRPN